MISSTLGAPFGGTTVGGHQGLEVLASWVITPPKAGGGGGSWSPRIVVVALGAPRGPRDLLSQSGARHQRGQQPGNADCH
jgi:hypothetical protein